MMKNTSLRCMGIFLTILSFTTTPAFCQGGLPSAVYQGQLSPDGPSQATIYVHTGGTYSSFWTNTATGYFATSNLFLAPGFPPKVTVSSQVFTNGWVRPNTWGNIKYFTQVSKKDPRVPDGTQVKLFIRIKAIVSMFRAADTLLPDASEALVDFNNERLAHIWVSHYDPTTLEKSIDVTVSRSVLVGSQIPIIIQAGGGWTATAYNANGGIFAFVDPVINIDPNYMVTVDGVSVPVTQVVKLEFSPGFNPVSCTAMLNLLLLD